MTSSSTRAVRAGETHESRILSKYGLYAVETCASRSDACGVGQRTSEAARETNEAPTRKLVPVAASSSIFSASAGTPNLTRLFRSWPLKEARLAALEGAQNW